MSHPRSGAIVASALLPLCLLLSVGCAQIIGLDDYTVAQGGSGGTVSTGGGTGGEAGALGEAGVLGEAGAAPATPPAMGCDGTTPLAINDGVLRDCILRNACSPLVPVRTISDCVTDNTPDAFGQDCKVTSCADYEACEHNGIAGNDLCPKSKWGTNFCVGSKAVSCASDGAYSLFVDCVGLGGTGCGTYTDENGDLQADCTLSGPSISCNGTTPGTYVCSSETTALYDYQCTAGQAYGIKCGSSEDCEDSGTGASCYVLGNACTKTQCSADKKIAQSCADGVGYQYDCNSVGLTCALSTDGNSNFCVAPGCKPADVTGCQESCSGSKLNLCYGGAQITVDCVDYGFATCDTFSDNNKNSFATCLN